METFILKLNESVTLEKSNEEYINDCCKDCDVLLNLIKQDIEKEFKIGEAEIGQEDWGWYLVFQKDNLIYNLHLSFCNEVTDSTEFLFYGFVKRVEKKFLFTKKTDATEETRIFEEKLKVLFAKFGNISLNN